MISHTLHIPTIVAADHLPTLLTRDSPLSSPVSALSMPVSPERAGSSFPKDAFRLSRLGLDAISGNDPLLDALRAEVVANTVSIPSDATDRLCQVAQAHRSTWQSG